MSSREHQLGELLTFSLEHVPLASDFCVTLMWAIWASCAYPLSFLLLKWISWKHYKAKFYTNLRFVTVALVNYGYSWWNQPAKMFLSAARNKKLAFVYMCVKWRTSFHYVCDLHVNYRTGKHWKTLTYQVVSWWLGEFKVITFSDLSSWQPPSSVKKFPVIIEVKLWFFVSSLYLLPLLLFVYANHAIISCTM